MRRFAELEGLRAWLAWSVVAWHLFMFSDLDRTNLTAKLFSAFSGTAVDLFIIISGFVISHLVTTRSESWLRYITRRFFRIFPNYLLVCGISAFTAALAVSAMRQAAWHEVLGRSYLQTISQTYNSSTTFVVWHTVSHLTLLQGVIPDSVLPYSSAVFLGPAWSLSLEWQFYLVAPFLIAAVAARRTRLPILVLSAAGVAAFHLGLVGTFRLRSILIAATYLFLIGIISRLGWDFLARHRRSIIVATVAILIGSLMIRELLSVGLWLTFLGFMLRSDQAALPTAPYRIWRLLFGSRPMRYLGERSFSVYIAHWPILQVAMWLIIPLGRSQAVTVAGVASLVVPATLVASTLLFRFVERPFMRLGRRLADGWERPPGPIPRTELVQP